MLRLAFLRTPLNLKVRVSLHIRGEKRKRTKKG